MNKLLLAAVACLSLPLAGQTHAAGGQDKASNSAYAKGYGQGQNGGAGFKPFKVVAAGAAGTFVFSAAEAEGNKGTPAPRTIDSAGKSFGLYAQKKGAFVTIRRGFAVPLTRKGDSFSLDFVGGFNDTGAVGIALTTGQGTTGSFVFHGGGPGVLFNGRKTGLGYMSGASHLVYTLTSPATYSLQATGAYRFTGTGAVRGSVTGFQVQQTSSGGAKPDHNAYFNNLSLRYTH